MKFLIDKKIGILFIVLLVVSALYPTYFISDDWEHLDSIYKNGSNVYLKFWIYRIPALYFSHTTLFPLFLNEYFMLANFICWFFFFLGMLYALETFKVLERLKKEPLWFFILFFLMICFNHNNFEFIFWPSFMVNFPGFFLVCFGFYITKRYNTWKMQFLRSLLWVTSFYFTESLFFMGALLEIAYVLWFLTERSLKDKIIFLVKQFLIPTVLLVVSKITLTYLKPYGYAAALGFKPHLLSQTLSLIFLHDYYKVRWLTGGLALFSYIGLFTLLYKIRGRKKILRTELIFSIIVLISTSYYFLIMDYSARRAIGGQLFITWGGLCLAYLAVWRQDKKSKLRSFILVLFPLCWMAHSTYVINLKVGDRKAFRRNGLEIRNKMEKAKSPVHISRDDIMKDVNTGWNLVNEKQTSGWVRHFFSEDELKKLSY